MAKTAKQTTENKPKAERYPIAQMLVTSAYLKVFSTGKRGFFGQAIDAATGRKFQIIGAVEIAAKN